ncbi:hypothetical protein CBS147332_4180 [Penicillium roqueforti]|nr:hypothetical protein CBS147332_4180 [Penicillium roqueforti]KAI3109041.1 hypothetical protein CBS147331_5833 [Penicillium roqueforti]
MAETHLTNRTIYEEIDRIKRNDPEATFYGVWNSILALQFPCPAGYVTRFHGENELLFRTYHYMDFKTIPTNFLVVQCKRQSLQARPSGWEEGVNQLTQYLNDTHGKRPIGLRRPVYGFVAIGKLMKCSSTTMGTNVFSIEGYLAILVAISMNWWTTMF